MINKGKCFETGACQEYLGNSKEDNLAEQEGEREWAVGNEVKEAIGQSMYGISGHIRTLSWEANGRFE